ncbi:putative F-box protein At2g33190 [Silene latifolia]|uniref:putative F-box protein At2g33190 n=1 Tax=Silene latifolia TaxID=37657 RepID=UPI003D7793A7
MAANDWSTLPLDLLGAIAMKLETLDDFIYFSAVCHSWNRVSSLIKHQWRPTVPWLLLAENTSNNPHCVRKIFNPSNNKCYKLNLPEIFGAKCWGSDYGWIAMVDRKLDVRLFNPITKAEIRFPSAETIPNRRPYDEEVDEDEEDYISWFLELYMKKLIVLKVSQNEFVILVIYHSFGHLAFAKPGDKSWTSVFVKKGHGCRMFDVMAMNGYVFALYSNASLVYWNIEDFQGYELVKPMDYLSSELQMSRKYHLLPFIHGISKLYLVESDCDLLLVLRFKESMSDDHPDIYETVGFSVYRLDPKDRRWEEIKDHATLFVGVHSAMSVSAKSLQPNCIYFTDDEFEQCKSRTELGQPDMGVYDIKCEEKWRFYEGDDIRSAYCTPTWFIPQLQIIGSDRQSNFRP